MFARSSSSLYLYLHCSVWAPGAILRYCAHLFLPHPFSISLIALLRLQGVAPAAHQKKSFPLQTVHTLCVKSSDKFKGSWHNACGERTSLMPPPPSNRPAPRQLSSAACQCHTLLGAGRGLQQGEGNQGWSQRAWVTFTGAGLRPRHMRPASQNCSRKACLAGVDSGADEGLPCTAQQSALYLGRVDG